MAWRGIDEKQNKEKRKHDIKPNLIPYFPPALCLLLLHYFTLRTTRCEQIGVFF